MRVPGIPQPSVSLNPLPDVNYHTPQTGALGGLVQNLGQMSEANIEASNLRVSEQENKARLLQATIRNEAAQVKGAGVLPKEGQTFIDSHLQKWDENVSKLATELNGSYQQRLFKKRMGLLRTSLTADLDAHEKAETRVYADGVDEATVNLEAQNAGANIDSPKDLSIGQMRVYGAVESMAKRNGWGPEEAQEKRLKAIGGFHVSVLGAAVDRGKLDYAKNYLEQHRDEIPEAMRVKIQNAIQGEQEDSLSVALGREALQASLSAGYDKTKGYEYIDQKAGNNKGLRDKAMSVLDHDFGVYKSQRTEAEANDESAVWGEVLAGNGPSAAFKAINKAQNLDNTKRAELVKKVQNYFKGDAEDRTAAREARKERQEALLLQYKLNPDYVWQMRDQDFINLLPQVGPSGVNQLVDMKKAMQGKGPVNAQADADTFKGLCKDAGVNPNNGKAAQIKAKIEAQIDQEQKANSQHPNRELPRARRDEIARYWFSKVLTDEGEWWGKETKRRYEVNDPQSIVKNLPPEHMGEIVRYLETQSVLEGRKQPISLGDLTPDQIIALDQRLFPGK